MDSLDYRGLGRCGHILLSFVLMVVSTWFVAVVFMLLGTRSAFAAVGLATFAPIYGITSGAIGALFAKSSVISKLRPTQVSRTETLWEVAASLAAKINMPVPEIYIYEDSGLNAWATGCRPEASAVIVTRGLLINFEGDELAAIIAHELGHIASGDTWRMQFASSYQKSMVWYLDFAGVRWLVRGTIGAIGELAVLSLSRRREYWADAVGAALTSPDAMVRALERIHGESGGKVPWKLRRSAMRWAGGGVLLSSHPTCNQRVSAVREGTFVRSVLRKLGQRETKRDIVPVRRVMAESLPVLAMPDEKSPELPQWASYRDELRKLGEVSVKEEPTPHSTAVLPQQKIAPTPMPTFTRVKGWEDSMLVRLVPVLALVLAISAGVYIFSQTAPNVPVLVAEPKVAPRVAAWEQRTEAPPVVPPKIERSPDEQVKREHFRAIEQELTRKIAEIERMRYPKEARFEPDETLGDPELTPYQLLVEHGTNCVYQANQAKEFIHQHMEDSGPDKSDLLVFLLDPTEPNGARRLASAGEKIKQCWKSAGGSAVAMAQNGAAAQPYDVWMLKDTKSGATAECGMWKTVRAAKKGRVAIAAYCR